MNVADLLVRARRALIAPLAAFAISLAVSAVALLVAGYSPATAFKAMWQVLDSTQSVTIVINRAAPYYVGAVAVAIGFRMGLFNIGIDGQYRLAALFAAYVGGRYVLPAPLHVGLIFLVAAAVGGMWAAIAGVLKVTRGVNEVVSTIMLNFIATGLIAWLLRGYFRFNPTGENLVAETRTIAPSGRIPSLNRIVEWTGFHFAPGVVLQGFLPFAVAIGVGYHILLNRSRFGFELRISGENPSAARAAGVNPKKMILITMIISGAVGALMGVGPLIADNQLYKYGDQFPAAFGFIALGIALLGRNSPVGIALAALMWAAIERGTQPLSIIGIPQEIGKILQGTFLLVAVIAFEVTNRRNRRRTVAEAAAKSHLATAEVTA